MVLTEQNLPAKDKDFQELSNPYWDITLFFTHYQLSKIKECYDTIQDEIRHDKKNAKSHTEEIIEHWGGEINNVLDGIFIPQHYIPFSTFTIRFDGDKILYVDAASRRVKIECIILGLKIVMDERNMDSSNLDKYLIIENGLKFEHMKTNTWYTDTDYLGADDIVELILSGDYDWEEIKKPYKYNSGGKVITIRRNQEVNFKEQIEEYVKMWRQIVWFDSSESADKSLFRVLSLHKFNFNSEDSNRGFRVLNQAVEITQQAKVYGDVKSNIEIRLESTDDDDKEFQDKFEELNLDMNEIEQVVADETKKILSNLDIHDKGRNGYVSQYIKWSLPIVKGRNAFKLDKSNLLVTDNRTYHTHLSNDFTEIVEDTIMDSILGGNFVYNRIRKNIGGSDWQKTFVSIRNSFVDYPILRAFLRPVVSYLYFNNIDIDYKLQEVLSYLNIIDTVTISGAGFVQHQKMTFECLEDTNLLTNPAGTIWKHFYHDDLSKQIANGKVTMDRNLVHKETVAIDFILGCEGADSKDKNQREWRKQQQRYSQNYLDTKDKKGATIKKSSEHLFNQKIKDDKNKSYRDDKVLKITKKAVNQFSLDLNINKELNQKGLETPILKEDTLKNMDFYKGPTLHQMANRSGHFNKTFSFEKDNLYTEMKMEDRFIKYYIDMANSYHKTLTEDYVKVF